MRCANASGAPSRLLHSRRGLEGEGPRAVADPGRARRAARRARGAPVPVGLRDRPGRGGAAPGPSSSARRGGSAARSTGRSAGRWRLLPHGAAPSGDPRAPPPGAPRRVAGTDEHAALVSGLLLATRAPSGEGRLEACAAAERAFREVPWPPELEPLRRRLRGGRGRPGGLPHAAGLAPRAAARPALPARGRARREVAGAAVGAVPARGRRPVQLDLAYLREQLLPQLAEAHFGPLAESEFVVAVVRRADRSVVFSSDPPVELGAPQPDDVQRSLPGRGGRPGADRDRRRPGPRPDERPPDDGPRGPRAGAEQPPEDESPWLLVARHRGGLPRAGGGARAPAQPRRGPRRPRAPRGHRRRFSPPVPSGPAASLGSRWSSWPVSPTS